MRKLLSSQQLAVLGFAGLNALNVATASAQTDKAKPNIIFLLTDDQRWTDLGCMGNPHIQTPNIDSLGYQGTIFENAYVTTSICVVSRASIMTGMYARRHGIYDFVTSFTERQWQSTYHMLLKQHGYKVGFVGKFGVHEWTRESYPMNDFDAWYGAWIGQGEYNMFDDDGKPITFYQTHGATKPPFRQ